MVELQTRAEPVRQPRVRGRWRWPGIGPRWAVATVLLVGSAALVVPLLLPDDAAIRTALAQRGLAPFGVDSPPDAPTALLGTDSQGRDVLVRLVLGARMSLAVAFAAILFGGVLGTAVGLLSGYAGGVVDAVVMRVVDILISLPMILIALVAAVTLTPSFWTVSLVIAFMLLPRYARQVRGDVLALTSQDFVALARINGCSHLRVAFVHVLPNITSGIIVMTSLQIGWAVLIESSLSFLGAGIPPPVPTLGGMIADGRGYLQDMWWVSLAPGALIMVVVLAFNSIGDRLRDVLDPRSASAAVPVTGAPA